MIVFCSDYDDLVSPLHCKVIIHSRPLILTCFTYKHTNMLLHFSIDSLKGLIRFSYAWTWIRDIMLERSVIDSCYNSLTDSRRALIG
jgi:hypothetical protein